MTRGTTTRRGFTLVELLVAVVLLLVLLGIASLTTTRALATHARTATIDSRRSAMSDALLTLQRQVASAEPGAGDLRAAADTALEIVRDIGVTTVCRAVGDTLIVTSGPDTVAWAATVPRAITSDDRLRIWHDHDARWVNRLVVNATPGGGACGDSSVAWPATGTQRLVLDSTTIGLHPGVVVRVRQPERWSLVRGADGTWALSLATWDAARNRFTAPQPLLSPLAAPSARGGPGLVVRARDAQGRALPDTLLTLARAIEVTVRFAAATRVPPLTDSVRINVGPR